MTLELLANAAVRMLLVSALVWLVLRIVRVRNPHVETLLWRMWMLASLALPALLYWRLAPHFTTSLQLPVISAAGMDADDPLPHGMRSALRTLIWPAAIYLGVAALLLARLAAGLLGMWRISRAARPLATPDDVRVTARIRSPATFGTIILLPPDALARPAESLDAILQHERMHVRGRDSYWSWLARLHTAVFWFNPLAWWLQRRLETLAETTSDDAVVAAHHDPAAYAALLLDFARHPNPRSVVMSVAKSNVAGRIERLLAGIQPAAVLPSAARWAAFAVMIPVVVLAASTTRAAPPAESAAAVPKAQAAQPVADGVRIVHAPDPDKFYPQAAKQERVTGHAVVKVSVDSSGRLLNVAVVEVQPVDPRYGFADAAVQVARGARYENPSQKDSFLVFMVKFALTE